jgi:hypothetical protein
VFYKSTIFPGISEDGINIGGGSGFISAIKGLLEESGLLKELFLFLANDLRWNRTRKLSFQRLFLFSCLFQSEFPIVSFLPFQPSVDDDGMIWANTYDGILIPSNLKTENKLISASFFSPSSFTSSASTPGYQLILQNILLSSLHAKNPISLRYYSLFFIRQLLSQFRETVSFVKVKSFKFWKKQFDWKAPPFSIGVKSYEELVVMKQSMQVTFQCLINGLNDGDESVRSLILTILQENVNFITADDESKVTTSSSTGEVVSFSTMMEKLLLALIVNSSSREATKNEMEEINEVLRMLCVLDPISAEQLIRKEFTQFSEVIEKTPFLSEIMNSLVNHVDLLQSLENI